MIESIDNPIPAIAIYSIERDWDLVEPAGLNQAYLEPGDPASNEILQFPIKEFVRVYEEEASRTWPHLPFFPNQVGDANHADSFWSPVAGIEKAKQAHLADIAMKFRILNAIMEECLHDYRVFYNMSWKRSTPCEVIKIHGKQFAAPVRVTDMSLNTTVFIALTDLVVRLTRFDAEFPVGEGQVFITPTLFPYNFQVKSSKSGTAYYLTKSLHP